MNNSAIFQLLNENKLQVTLTLSFMIHLIVLFAFQMQAPGSRLMSLQTTIELTDLQEELLESPKPREIIKKTCDEPAEEIIEKKIAIPPVPKKQVFLPFYKVEQLPMFKTRIMPAYPEQARKLGRTSQVILEAYIDAKGIVRQVRVLKSGGVFFDKAAISALQASYFKPALIMGRAVPVKIRVPYIFQMDR